MKIFGSISELVDLAFRLAGGKQVRLLSKTQTATDDVIVARIPDVAATGSDQEILLTKATQNIFNKTLQSNSFASFSISSENATISNAENITAKEATFGDSSTPGTAVIGTDGGITVNSALSTFHSLNISTQQVADGLLQTDGTGSVSSAKLLNKNIDLTAAISFSKLAPLSSANILVGSGSDVATSVPVSGDVTLDNTGSITINNGVVGDAQLADSISSNQIVVPDISNPAGKKPVVTNASGVLIDNPIALTDGAILSWDNTNGQFTSISADVSFDELNQLDGINTDETIQSQLDGKVDSNTLIPSGSYGTYPKITFDAKGLVTAGGPLIASDMPSAIDATKISTGVVSNTEFDYLYGVTSAIQTQLNSKVTNDFVPGSVIVSDGTGKQASSTITSDELNQLEGISQAKTIQQQINDIAEDSGLVTETQNHTLTGNISFTQDVSISNGKMLKLFEPENGLNYVGLKAPLINANVELTLPDEVGAAGSVLSSDGSGNLQWATSGNLPSAGTAGTQSLALSDGVAWGYLPKGANGQVLTTNSSGNLEYIYLTNGNISDEAGINYSKLSLSNSIVNADIASAAAIAYSKLNLTNSIVTGDIKDGNITGAKLASDSVTSAKIAANAVGSSEIASNAVTTTKIADGDVTNAKLASNAVTNIKVDANAAISGTKISPNFGSQNISTTGSVTGGSFSGSGSSLTNLNASNLSSGTVASARLPEATSSAIGGVWLPQILEPTPVQGTIGNSVYYDIPGFALTLEPGEYIAYCSCDFKVDSTTLDTQAGGAMQIYVNGVVQKDMQSGIPLYNRSGLMYTLLHLTTKITITEPASQVQVKGRLAWYGASGAVFTEQAIGNRGALVLVRIA